MIAHGNIGIIFKEMTPQFQKSLEGNYIIHCAEFISPFGTVFIATLAKYLISISFKDTNTLQENQNTLNALKSLWQDPDFVWNSAFALSLAERIFNPIFWKESFPVYALVKGSVFQIDVWKALLAIPVGSVQSYSEVAQRIGNLSSARAVGLACKKNPLAFVIPCHRVILKNTETGSYRWSVERKKEIVFWEKNYAQKYIKAVS